MRAIYAGRAGGTEQAVDDVVAFFQAVHHLKDWLGNDTACAVTKPEGDLLIDGSSVLQLCADVANGSKHLKLTSTRTGDKSTSLARNDVSVGIGTGKATHRFYVASGGQEHDVLVLAEAAVGEWTSFLGGRELI